MARNKRGDAVISSVHEIHSKEKVPNWKRVLSFDKINFNWQNSLRIMLLIIQNFYRKVNQFISVKYTVFYISEHRKFEIEEM